MAELMRRPIGWAEAQFRALGRADARDLAFDLLAAYEGSAAQLERIPKTTAGVTHR